MIPFGPAETKEALFQDWIASVPKSQREAQALVIIANTGDSIFRPAVHARACVIVREVVPGSPIGAIVFARISPGAFCEIRPPAPPVFLSGHVLLDSFAFGVDSLFRTTVTACRFRSQILLFGIAVMYSMAAVRRC